MSPSFSRRFSFGSAAALACLIVLGSCTPIDGPPANANVESMVTRRPDGGVGTSADPVIVAAGDIVCGNNTAPGTACQHAQTAALIGTISPQAVLLLGDNQYEDGTFAEYNALYGPTWGQYKAITYPSVGNHEYQTANAAGYFDYFNGVGVQTGRAGDRSKGYYSYDMGAWHLIALNSNCGAVGGCGAGSAQEVWLKADLLAHPNSCTLAYWHHPRFSSGAHGNDASTQALWAALYAAKADVILAGHDHNYERFAPMTATGVLDNTNGIRSWVVGTGGKEQRSMGTTKANSVLRSNNSFGVLKLTLHTTSYDWQFVATAGGSLNDAGTSNCVGLPPGNQPPTASITSPAAGSNHVQGASVSFAGTGTDPEQGALTGSSLTWTSSIDGAIGTGVSFSRNNLSLGTHTITLTATDAQGLIGTATRSITVAVAPPANQPPVAAFTASCALLNGAYHCAFNGSASSDDHGVVSWAWKWSDGRGTTRTIPTLDSYGNAAGTYTMTLTVKDASGLTNSITKPLTIGTPQNLAPTASISLPANNFSAMQGTPVSFSGSASDPESGQLTGSALVWTSNIDGPIGSGVSFTLNNLSVGTHTISLRATDPAGLTSPVIVRTLLITAAPPTNQAPVAAFSWNCAPFNGAYQCNFDGSASTDDGGVVSWAWKWSDGRGTTRTFPTLTSYGNLPGTYTVTLTVKDAAGLTGSITKTVLVP